MSLAVQLQSAPLQVLSLLEDTHYEQNIQCVMVCIETVLPKPYVLRGRAFLRLYTHESIAECVEGGRV